MNTGKWVVSNHKEQWDCFELFDTKEEAIIYAQKDFADHCGLESGDHAYIGQINKFTNDELTNVSINARVVIEAIEDHIYEEQGELVDGICSEEQENELNECLKNITKQWLDKYEINKNFYGINNVFTLLIENPKQEKENEE